MNSATAEALSKRGLMERLTVTACYPLKLPAEPGMRIMRGMIPVRLSGPTIYNVVDFFEQALFPVLPRRTHHSNDRVQLAQLLNLHNLEGMRDVPQIRGMLRQIQAGGDVLHATGLPNVKLVTTCRGEWVLFDGHHTTIAYMAAGRRYLDELPHLMVHHRREPIPDSDILVVFGSHAPLLSTSNWRDYTINWQAPPEEQLAKRVQPSMRGLFDVLARNNTFLSTRRISISS